MGPASMRVGEKRCLLRRHRGLYIPTAGRRVQGRRGAVKPGLSGEIAHKHCYGVLHRCARRQPLTATTIAQATQAATNPRTQHRLPAGCLGASTPQARSSIHGSTAMTITCAGLRHPPSGVFQPSHWGGGLPLGPTLPIAQNEDSPPVRNLHRTNRSTTSAPEHGGAPGCWL